MTVTAAPAPTAHARPTPTGRAFVRAYRGTGHGKVHAAVVAAGPLPDGRHARLALPIERVVMVDLRHLPTAANRTVNLVAGSERSDPQARLAEKVVEALGRHGDISGPFTGAVRLPGTNDGGADLANATVTAALEAFCAVTEQPLSGELARVAHAAAGEPAAVCAGGGVNIHRTDTGEAVTQWESFPRFYTVFVHQVAGPGGISTALVTDAGSLDALPERLPTGEADVARLLAAASAPREVTVNPARALLEEVHATTEQSLALIGGHAATDPVALLLPADHASLLVAQRLHTQIAKRLTERFGPRTDAGWRVTISRLSGS